MFRKIEVDRTEGDLVLRTWRFCLLDEDLVLDAYEEHSRPSKRHSFRLERGYHRIGRGSEIKEADVPLPEDVKKDAMAQVVSYIRVGKWGELRPGR